MFERLKVLCRLSDAIKSVNERLDAVETQQKHIELEWDETYDKFRTLTARLCKRAERNSPDENPTPPSTSPSGGNLNPFSSLTGRAAEVQAAILARRHRFQNGGIHE